MLTVTPAGLVLVPVTVIATAKRKWAIYYLLASIPFFALRPVIGFSHQFTVSELALLSLGVNQFAMWMRNGSLEVPHVSVTGGYFAFLGVCALSVLYAIMEPPSIATHPYNSGSIGVFWVKPYVLHPEVVSQLALRVLFVAAVVLLLSNIERNTLFIAIRGVILGGIFVGVVGNLFQLSVAVGSNWFPLLLQEIGFVGFRTNIGSFGPIPRMFSTTGEPGYTALYLLYALSLASGSLLFSSRWLPFHRRTLYVLTGVLFLELLLTTSTTGYGGMIILACLLGTVAFISGGDVRHRFAKYGVIVGAVSLFALLGAVSLFSGFLDLIWYQVEKLQFDAGSGSIRLQYILHSIRILEQRPILGVGVGSHYGASLIGTIAAEMGITGVLVFLGLIVQTVRSGISTGLNHKGPFAEIGLISAAAAGTLMLTSLFAKSIVTLLFPWVWLALSLPTIAVIYVQSHLPDRDESRDITNKNSREQVPDLDSTR